ncbi:MAG: 6-carboxytetrahydropterin synthase [Opitutaceae bacterium]
MFTCSKTYSDIPFAHRQHRHDGHCSLIHGHNWSIRLTFGAHENDANGFVVDFGRLRFLRDWIEDNLDHACVFNEDDPLRATLVAAAPDAYRVYLVPSCSCEGLAQHLFEVFDPMVRARTEGRAFLIKVEIWEDSRNSATYRPPGVS